VDRLVMALVAMVGGRSHRVSPGVGGRCVGVFRGYIPAS
jgi:hypothetical protein